MTISLYEASVPLFIHSLQSLKALLQKGQAHAEARKFDPVNLVNARLAPDMLPLSRQVQIATDAAKGAAARLTGTDSPKFEDTETTFPELIARVDKTIDYLKRFKPAQFEGAETRATTVKLSNAEFSVNGLVFLRHMGIPNFYFHLTTAYALLRHNGVELGKKDFLGQVN